MPAPGLVLGGVTGAAVGASSDAAAQAQARAEQQAYNQSYAAGSGRRASNYRRAISACLSARGYTIG